MGSDPAVETANADEGERSLLIKIFELQSRQIISILLASRVNLRRQSWGNQTQQQSSSRWLLAAGMGKGNKHPVMKSKAPAKPTKEAAGQAGDTLWSISSRVYGAGTRWGELAGTKNHS